MPAKLLWPLLHILIEMSGIEENVENLNHKNTFCHSVEFYAYTCEIITARALVQQIEKFAYGSDSPRKMH